MASGPAGAGRRAQPAWGVEILPEEPRSDTDSPHEWAWPTGPGAASDVLQRLQTTLAAMTPAPAADIGLSPELHHALAPTGALSMLLPSERGGAALTWAQSMSVIETLARISGSLGWRVSQIAQAHNVLSCFPESGQDAALSGEVAALAGSVAPKGHIATDEDLTVTGQWPFVTGAPAARWVYLNCLEVKNRAIVRSPAGVPSTRMVLLPVSSVTLLDTWDVLGLRATDSWDVQCRAVHVEPGFTFTVDPDSPSDQAVVDKIARSGLLIAACTIGIAAGALDDLLDSVRGGKRRTFSTERLAVSPVVQHELGERAAGLLVARAGLAHVAEWNISSAADRTALRACTSSAAAVARDCVEWAYRVVGGSAVYEGAPLQKRLRDALTAAQHVVAGTSFYQPLGQSMIDAKQDKDEA